MNTLQIKIRSVIHFFTGSFDRLVGNSPKIFILNYHGVSDSGWKYDISKEKILKEIDMLLGYCDYVELSEINKHLNNKNYSGKPLFSITFDDGYKDVISIAQDLNKRGIKPAVFVLSHTEKSDRAELENKKSFLSIKELNQLIKLGWTIGSHGATHQNFHLLDTKKDIIFEVKTSKEKISALINKKVEYLAYPKGAYNRKILESVSSSGYAAAYTVDPDFVNNATNRYLIPRIGVDNTHSISELRNMITPTSVFIRKYLKRFI